MRKAIRRGGAVLLFAGVAFSAATSAASDPLPIAMRSAVGADLLLDTNGTFVSVSFFHYEIARGLFVDADLPLAGDGARQGGGFGAGNPTLGLHYAASTLHHGATGFLGVRVGIPLATAGGESSDQAALDAAFATAYYDPYRWTVEHLPFIWLIGLEAQPTRGFWIRLPIEPMLFIPTSKAFALRGGAQARFELEGLAPNGVGGGCAAQVVVGNLFPPGNTSSRAEVAVEPYFAFDNGVVIGRAGLIVALSDPLGPLGVVTGHIQIGGHLQ